MSPYLFIREFVVSRVFASSPCAWKVVGKTNLKIYPCTTFSGGFLITWRQLRGPLLPYQTNENVRKLKARYGSMRLIYTNITLFSSIVSRSFAKFSFFMKVIRRGRTGLSLYSQHSDMAERKFFKPTVSGVPLIKWVEVIQPVSIEGWEFAIPPTREQNQRLLNESMWVRIRHPTNQGTKSEIVKWSNQ